MEREFNYKGYSISTLDEYPGFPFRWMAVNTNDCDESRIIDKTFENVLDEIDYRVEQKM